MGFVKNDADPNFYYLVVENELLILVLYVDDLFLTGSSKLIGDCKKNLAIEFNMKDLGRMHYFLRVGSLAAKGRDVPWAREICYKNLEEIQDGGLYTHGYSNDHQLEED